MSNQPEPVKRRMGSDITLYGPLDEKYVAAWIYDRDIEAARFAPLGDNHHNAAECPYCNPKYVKQAKTIERLRGMVNELVEIVECIDFNDDLDAPNNDDMNRWHNAALKEKT